MGVPFRFNGTNRSGLGGQMTGHAHIEPALELAVRYKISIVMAKSSCIA